MLNQALQDCNDGSDNPAMLDKNETATRLRGRLELLFTAWLESAQGSDRSKAMLARECQRISGRKCTPQTVNSWFKTGRMDKAWIPIVETLLGGSLGFSAASALTHPSAEGLAHVLSQRAIETRLPITWESFMTEHKAGTLSKSFIVICPDDAMAPMARKGDELFFRIGVEPRIGDGVIVRDKHDGYFIRMYSEGDRPGLWTAKARKEGYRTLHSEADELTVVAVLRVPERGWADM